MVNSYDLDPIEGARMYWRNAFDFHLLEAPICASDMPWDAAPILKVWDLYPETSKSHKRRGSAKAFVKKSPQQNSGPGDKPLDLNRQAKDKQGKLVVHGE